MPTNRQPPADPPEDHFWQRKPLAEMTDTEWESLCDGCAKCCLIKLQDEDDDPATADVDFTDVACHLLDSETCRCTRYDERHRRVPDCVRLDRDDPARLGWMPSTCAYRLLARGEGLMWWHHLVCGDREMVHTVGMSVRGRVISEKQVDDAELEDHIVDWPA